jgi:hypothetical protein
LFRLNDEISQLLGYGFLNITTYTPIVDPTIDSTKEIPVMSVLVGYETGEYGLRWKECAGAQKYELEETSFLWGKRIVYSGPYLGYSVGNVTQEFPLTFRLRADYGDIYSLWSDPVTLPM